MFAEQGRVAPAWPRIAGLLTVVLAACLAVGELDAEQRLVALPALAIGLITLAFIYELTARDGVLPVFEVGTMAVAATAVYSAAPLIAFLLSGMTWTILSDARLVSYHPTAAQMGAFFWRHVVYLGCLAASYLAVRGRASAYEKSLDGPDEGTQISVFVLLSLVVFYFWILFISFGVSYGGSYEDVRNGVGLQTTLPYFVQQITNNVYSMRLVLKFAAVLLLLQRWRSGFWRAVLVLWMVGETGATLLRMGGRSETALLLLATVLMFHRFVKPWKLVVTAFVMPAMLGGMLAYGAVRDTGLGLGSLQSAFAVSEVSPWSTMNEFQVLFGTPYDLYMRKTAGTLPPTPWQVSVSDFLLPIPSQLLPVPKIDPSEWYLGAAGLLGSGFGAMFGVISQAIVGFDWIELVVRGCVLGFVLAKFHRWYVQRQRDYWSTLLYLFVCVWSYYTFRASTFYFATFIVYQFVPALLAVRIIRTVLRGTLSARPTPA